MDILEVKYNAGSTIGYTLQSGIIEITEFNSMINSSLPDKVKIKTTDVDSRRGSNLTTNKTMRFTKNRFFFTIIGFIQSH